MLIIGHRGAAGLVSENTLSSFEKAHELKVDMVEFDLRRRSDGKAVVCHDKDKSGQYQNCPTLAEAMAVMNLPIDIDVKDSGLEPEILASLKNFPHRVLVTSWNPLVIKKIRTLDGKIAVGPVLGRKYRFLLPFVIGLLKPLKLSWITLDVALVSERLMNKFKRLGWNVYVFTNDDGKVFNDPQVFQRLKNLGVAGIFTDYPNIVSKLN